MAPTQGTSTRYTFQSWSHGGPASQTIVIPSSSTTYTANFLTQHRLTGTVSPSQAGTISFSPSSGDGYYNAGVVVQASAVANPNFQFSNWSGAASGSSNPVSLTMNAPQSLTANFSTVSACSFILSPQSTSVLASGNTGQVSVSTAASCNWTAAPGASWIAITSGASGAGNGSVRYSIASNSSSSSRTGNIQIGSAIFTIFQAGGGCSFSLSGPGGFLPASGSQFPISIPPPADANGPRQQPGRGL